MIIFTRVHFRKSSKNAKFVQCLYEESSFVMSRSDCNLPLKRFVASASLPLQLQAGTSHPFAVGGISDLRSWVVELQNAQQLVITTFGDKLPCVRRR